jgi:hypothetical protein
MRITEHKAFSLELPLGFTVRSVTNAVLSGRHVALVSMQLSNQLQPVNEWFMLDLEAMHAG